MNSNEKKMSGRYSEEDLLPVSALQHLVYCERQWGLIHLERIWAENLFTAQGRILHDRVHEDEGDESRGDVIITRGLELRSFRLGLTGKADVVEFHRLKDGHMNTGVSLHGRKGRWQPVPVEYKLGKPKIDRSDEIQLCGQALCLEEMLDVEVARGALYYGRIRRRTWVEFDASLRQATEQAALRLHALTRAGITPDPKIGKGCSRCSLRDECLPVCGGNRKSARGYLDRVLLDMGREVDEL